MRRKRTVVAAVVAALTVVPTAAAQWVQHPGPVITPTLPWEHQYTQEPSVIYENGRFRLWYTAGGETRCMVGYAESPDGVTWSKHPTPVLGWGHGGVRLNACHSNVQKLNGVYWMWFVQHSPVFGFHDGNIYAARSLDGVYWTPLPRAAIRMGGWAKWGANTFVVRDGKRWRMFWEAYGHVPDGRALWRLSTATSSDLIRWKVDRKQPLTGIGFGDTFGGPFITRTGRSWTMFFHAPPPVPTGVSPWYSQVYRATSLDLRRWRTSPVPVLVREQPSWQVDQIADATIATVNGRRVMFFSGLDNRWPIRASIGMAELR